MTASRSKVTATGRGLIVNIDGEAHRLPLSKDEMFSLATSLLNYAVVEMRNHSTHEALMSGAGAGSFYVQEEEESADQTQ